MLGVFSSTAQGASRMAILTNAAWPKKSRPEIGSDSSRTRAESCATGNVRTPAPNTRAPESVPKIRKLLHSGSVPHCRPVLLHVAGGSPYEKTQSTWLPKGLVRLAPQRPGPPEHINEAKQKLYAACEWTTQAPTPQRHEDATSSKEVNVLGSSTSTEEAS